MTLVSDNTSASMSLEESCKEKENWLFKWIFNWTRTSPIMLRNVEKKILSYLKIAYRGFFVDIGPAVGQSDKIWTVSMNTDSKEMPLVLLHGLGAGTALWVMNLDAFAKDRPVYAMDLLGFGRSSRPQFSKDPFTCEQQFVKSIEEWRREMNIQEMILLGHSFGGYLASSYTISYPDRVKHLILADPWGFPEKPKEVQINGKKMPLWVRTISYVLSPFNPLWALRVAGPFGELLVQKMRPDITRKFAPILQENQLLLPQYIHQCNAQTPAGESAFHRLMSSFGWARFPMEDRLMHVPENVPITFIYGSRSWITPTSAERIKAHRVKSFVDIKFVNGAGHHLFADKPEVFNRYVLEACHSDLTQTTVVENAKEVEEDIEMETSTIEQAEKPREQQANLQQTH